MFATIFGVQKKEVWWWGGLNWDDNYIKAKVCVEIGSGVGQIGTTI